MKGLSEMARACSTNIYIPKGKCLAHSTRPTINSIGEQKRKIQSLVILEKKYGCWKEVYSSNIFIEKQKRLN